MADSRPGGRSERVRVAILDAALAQLMSDGYDALSIGRVAKAAGVAETTVYRRWPTSADLAASALAHLAHTENPIPDTGSLAGDLRAILRQIIDLISRPDVERIVRTSAALDTTAAETRKSFWENRLASSAAIVESAVTRGELAAGTDPGEVMEFLVAPAYLRLLLLDRPLDADLLETSVRRTLAAFGAS
jgi:AcrR family transcriptional regulator